MLLLFIIGVSYVPYLICSRQADDWYTGNLETQNSLAHGMANGNLAS